MASPSGTELPGMEPDAFEVPTMDPESIFLPQDFSNDQEVPSEYDPGVIRDDILQMQTNLLQGMAAPSETQSRVGVPEVEVEYESAIPLNRDQLHQEVIRYQAAADARNRERMREQEALLDQQSDDDYDNHFESEDDDDEYQAPPAASKSKRGRPAGDDEPARKKPRKVASKKTPAKRTLKNTEGDPLTKPNTIHKIMRTNVFEDAQLTANLPAQPTLATGNRKSDALKSLLQSIPPKNQEAARSDKVKLDNAISKVIGARKVKYGSEEGFLLNGMKTPLKHYQVMGLAFMRDRENSEQRPRGGILADGMGLGKTVEALANIVNGKSLRKDLPKATLIVVPSNLMAQWQAEIRKHVYTEEEVTKRAEKFAGDERNDQRLSAKHGLKTIAIFKDLRKLKNPVTLLALLRKQDVVLATYHAVNKSYPPMKPPKEYHTALQKNEWYKVHFYEKAGPLHQIKWHRVILDEAHLIKNHLSNTSMACRALKARHYWALTGTPVQNKLDEFYSYFRFIRDPFVMSFRMFKANFCDEDDPDASPKLLAMLDRVMIRRTHADTMFGAKLLDIPRPQAPTTLEINFNHTERRLYEFIREKYCDNIKQMVRSGTLSARYNDVYTLMLRLRQATGHILLLHDTILDLLDQADLEQFDQHASSGDMKEDALASMLQLREMVVRLAEERTANPEQLNLVVSQRNISIDELIAAMPDANERIGASHGTRDLDYARYIKTFGTADNLKKIQQQTRCCYCNEEPVKPHITSCHHVYCLGCMEDLQLRAARIDRDGARCLRCNELFTEVTPCKELQATADAEENAVELNTVLRNGKPGKTSFNKWIRMKGPIAPSAKTMAMKIQVLEWLRKDPSVKIIIYSQFIPLLHIIGRVCVVEHWTYRRYQGDMTMDARDRAIRDFGDPEKKVQILLASLKCGGLGLNLTAASRVLIMDSWWNDSVEQQAFCRVFRHGQDKTTELTRLVVKGTIDEDMMRLKDRKLREINPVLEDERATKPSFTDLLRLFGPFEQNEDGTEFTFPRPEDAYEEDDHPEVIDDDS